MKKLGIALLLTISSLSSAAKAQVAEFSVSGGLNRLSDSGDLGSGYSLDNGWNLGFRICLNSETIFGQEFGYQYTRTALDRTDSLGTTSFGGMAVHQGFYNFLLYATKEGSRVRPFVTGGGHFSNFVPPGSSATQGGGDTKFGVNYGGGIKVKVTERYQIRADYRQYLTGKPFGDFFPVSGSLRQTQVSVGIGFTL